MSENDEKKIIIDEDWKSQVEAEREQLKHKSDDPAADSEPVSLAGKAAGSSDDSASASENAMQVPPASFSFLVSSIATQAMFALGQIPDPATGQPMLDMDLAKHHVDMLAVLDAKTKGNLSAEETEMLTETLHQLRMGFIAIQQHNSPS